MLLLVRLRWVVRWQLWWDVWGGAGALGGREGGLFGGQGALAWRGVRVGAGERGWGVRVVSEAGWDGDVRPGVGVVGDACVCARVLCGWRVGGRVRMGVLPVERPVLGRPWVLGRRVGAGERGWGVRAVPEAGWDGDVLSGVGVVGDVCVCVCVLCGWWVV